MTDQQDQQQRWAAAGIVALVVLIPGLAIVAAWTIFCEVCHMVEPLFVGWSLWAFLLLCAGAWVVLCIALVTTGRPPWKSG